MSISSQWSRIIRICLACFLGFLLQRNRQTQKLEPEGSEGEGMCSIVLVQLVEEGEMN